ncbi:MAG: DUF1800 domain-containing protein [Saprospiraceae bacterium]|nr:DUF1800 domain-containing protein [Saprospiraceae bacterium]
MANHSNARRDFLQRLIPPGGGVRVEQVFPDQADLTAAQFPETEFTLSGDLTPYTGPWGPEHAAHLLRRTTFGANKSQIDQLVALGSAEAAVDYVLNVPTTAPAPPVNNYNGPDFTDPTVPAGQTWINAQYNLDAEVYRIESWRGWWLDRMIRSDANIQEKMTLFWHTHFATRTETALWGRASYLYNKTLRENALGNFKDFVKAITLDPCMLIFLNGFLNNVTAPDENYARELQELFTVGKESASTYTEDDVVAAARVLTGWRINFLNATTFFDVNAHDTGFKVFSSFYNNTVIQGSTDGHQELDALLDMIFQKQEVAEFICRKIYRFFLYYKIDATVEADIIQPLAQIFRNNNYEIKPVMEALLNSEHFFDAYNKGCFIKTPLDLVVGVMRNYNLQIPGSTPYDEFQMRLLINYGSGNLQMLPGDPPNVAGWQAFRQSPGYYRMWINSDTMRNRNIITDVLSFFKISTDNDDLSIDHIEFAKQFDHPEDPNQLIDDTLRILLPMDISAAKKQLLKSILLSGQANDGYWTAAWITYLSDPGNQMVEEIVKFRLASMHKYMMNLAEYQLI